MKANESILTETSRSVDLDENSAKSTSYQGKTQADYARKDIKDSFLRYKLWCYLGWSDIQQRYRGTVLGPLWITLSMVIFVLALSLVYGRLFHQEPKTFLPYLTAGILCWTFISTVLTESTDVFIAAKTFIENLKLPFLLYLCRLIWRNQIIFLHNLMVFIAMAIFFRIDVSLNNLLFIPAMLLISILLISVGLVLGLLGTRFRDIPPVISSLIMLVFFVSPITWPVETIGMDSLIIKLNPLFYMLDIMRSPLLGILPALSSWLVCCVMTGLALLISFMLFKKYRSHIPFWL